MNMGKNDFVEEYEDELSDEMVTLVTDSGEEIDFFVAAVIPFDGKVYGILQPVELLEGMEEDEALVFEMNGEDGEQGFDLVTDDAIIDGVFAKYDELIANAEK